MPEGSWAADQAMVATPVSRAVNTRMGGTPAAASPQVAGTAANAAASPEAIQRKAQPAMERTNCIGAEAKPAMKRVFAGPSLSIRTQKHVPGLFGPIEVTPGQGATISSGRSKENTCPSGSVAR